MKKTLIIGLLFVSFGLSAQIGQWDSTQTIIYPTSTTAKIPLSVTDTIYLIDVLPSDSGNSYISRLGDVKMIYDFNQDATKDTIIAALLFPNFDYENKFYARISNKTLNINGTTNENQRITEIEVYSTSTDRNSYFNVPVYNSNALEVGAGKTYTTVNSALVAASSGDSVYIYTGYYPEANNISDKNLTIIAVGAGKTGLATGNTFRFSGAMDYIRLENLYVNGLIPLRNSGTITNNYSVTNCYVETQGTYSCYSTSGSGFLINNSILNGVVYSANRIEFNESVISETTQPTFRVQSSVDSLIITHSIINENTASSTINPDGDLVMYIFDTELKNRIILDEPQSFDMELMVDHCLIESSTPILNLNVTDSVKITFTNTDFYFNYNGTVMSLANQQEIRIEDCNIYDIDGYFLDVTDNNGDSLVVTACLFITDSSQTNSATDCKLRFEGNTMNAGEFSRVVATGKNVSNIPATIKNNAIITQGNNYENAAFIVVGNENDSDSDGKLNGSIVEGNQCIGPLFYGNPSPSGHGIFLFAQEFTARYNYVGYRFLGIVVKNRGDIYENNLSYNLTDQCISGFTIKGSPNSTLIGNTVSSSIGVVGFDFYEDENYPGSYSDSCTVKNNIIYDYNPSPADCFQFESASDTVGLDSDYNVVYSLNSEDIVKLVTSRYNLSEWQGFGYDNNSFNTNPNFKSSTELWPLAPKQGVNLGSTYENGLDISTKWPDNIVLKTQADNWIIGAYIVEKPEIIYIKNKEGKYVTYFGKFSIQ